MSQPVNRSTVAVEVITINVCTAMMEGAEVAGADDADAGKVMNGMGGKRDFF